MLLSIIGSTLDFGSGSIGSNPVGVTNLKLKKMRKYVLLVLLVLTTLCSSCTDNQRARQWGGTEEIILPKNHVLITATWKNDEMWILTKDTVTDINYFKEKSNWGVLEGTVIFKNK